MTVWQCQLIATAPGAALNQHQTVRSVHTLAGLQAILRGSPLIISPNHYRRTNSSHGAALPKGLTANCDSAPVL